MSMQEEKMYIIIDNIIYNLTGMIEYLFASENKHSRDIKIFTNDQDRFNRAIIILQLLKVLPKNDYDNTSMEFSLVTGVFADYYQIFRVAFIETCKNSGYSDEDCAKFFDEFVENILFVMKVDKDSLGEALKYFGKINKEDLLDQEDRAIITNIMIESRSFHAVSNYYDIFDRHNSHRISVARAAYGR